MGYFSARAQLRPPVRVEASYDTSGIPELLNTVTLGFTFIYADGSREYTRGWLGGKVRWRDLHVTTPQGTVENGALTFDRAEVWKNDHNVTFYLARGSKHDTCDLALPFVKNIRFNLYTDSLKRNNPFYLNVEGLFSSGRTYPLDTGMVTFRKSGGGLLQGNILSVSPTDTATHAVKMYAWLRADSALQDSIIIPVKVVPDTAALPTEQQLFNGWGKKKH